MHKTTATKVIEACADEVSQFIWDIQEWAHFWSPLHKVDILYDDGLHQDFVMSLYWQESNASVRTVRFRKDKSTNISFFSPKPPLPMMFQHGLWQMAPYPNGKTELTAIRWFSLPPQENAEEFCQNFQTRVEALLEKLGDVCKK